MARKKLITLKKPDSTVYRSWTFALVLGGILAVVALLHRAGENAADYAADGSTGCRVNVRVDSTGVYAAARSDAILQHTLNIADSPVDAYPRTLNGYRELEGGGWALDRNLVPVPGSTC